MQQLLQFRPSLGALNEPEAILTNCHWKTFISFSTVSLPSAKLVRLAISKTGLLHALVNMHLAALASINTGSIMLCLIFHGTNWKIPTHWLDRLHGLKLFKSQSISNKSVLIEEYIKDRYSEKRPQHKPDVYSALNEDCPFAHSYMKAARSTGHSGGLALIHWHDVELFHIYLPTTSSYECLSFQCKPPFPVNVLIYHPPKLIPTFITEMYDFFHQTLYHLC